MIKCEATIISCVKCSGQFRGATAVETRRAPSVALKMFVRVSELNPTVTANEDAQSPALLALAQQGDAEAFCELCRLNESRLLRQAMVLCGDAASAEDLAQDTLVAAWKSIRRYNGKCRFFTWLCSILIHLHRSELRKKQPAA